MSDYGQSAEARVVSHRTGETHTLKQPWLDTISAPARTSGTVYQNTTGKTILVVISVAGANGDTIIYVENANPPTVIIAKWAQNIYNAITFIVPAGYYYKATIEAGDWSAYSRWIEVS